MRLLMPLRPDDKTISDMKLANSIFAEFADEILEDFAELMNRLYGDSGGPRQPQVNIGFIGFCLGNLNACDEGSHFFRGMERYNQPGEVSTH
jgi:hypothetical protein